MMFAEPEIKHWRGSFNRIVVDSHQVEGQERCASDEVKGLPWVKVPVTR